ncbi:MAG TPA: hypothetical protein PKW36_03675, partial [bacterium]|nr:hypothetical protein [bacterium]
TQNLVSYEVIIEVENRDNKLLPGMTANLSIIVDTKKDVIKVPNMALRFQPALTQEQFKKYSAMYGDKFDLKNSAMVWTLQSGELAPIIVDPGLTDGQYTEIRSDQLTIEQILVTGISTVAAPGSARDRFAPKK